jgi:hypothetical protein
MHTFYKNIWGDWIKIYAIQERDINHIDAAYIKDLLKEKIQQIDIEKHPFLFQNIDGAFWVLRTKNYEAEKNLKEHFVKLEGVEWEIIEKQYW